MDVVDRALEKARRRCAVFPQVTICKARIPADPVAGPFDLILLSEVAYYWDSADLATAGDYLCAATMVGGHLLLVHWTGETDYPKSADEAVAELQAAAGARFKVLRRERRPQYRLDLWLRRSDQN